MTPSLIALSVLFLADDPTLPAVVLEVKEAPARQLTVFVVDDDHEPLTMQLNEGAAAGTAAGLPRWPLMPRGASLTPAVDGVILTIDDAGAWTESFAPTLPLPVATTKATATAKKPTPKHPWPPPLLPVAGDNAMRLFLPTVVDGEAMSASLHGPGGLAIAGTAVVWQLPLSPHLITLGGADLDVSVATIVASATPAGACAPVPTLLLQTTTHVAASLPACAAGFAVSVVNGQRYSDTKAGDLPARGVLVMSLTP